MKREPQVLKSHGKNKIHDDLNVQQIIAKTAALLCLHKKKEAKISTSNDEKVCSGGMNKHVDNGDAK